MSRMMHPLHGWHVASSADDLPAMRRNGWVDDDGRALAAKLLPPMPSGEGDDHLAQIKTALVAAFPPIKRGPGRPRKVA